MKIAALACVMLTACSGQLVAPRDAGRGDGAPGDSGTPPRDAGGPPVCGDSRIGLGESCDDGNRTDGDGCAADCSTVEPNFTCPRPGSPCTSTVVCGDGHLGDGEECDDRNLEAGDGCSVGCAIEPGWSCPVVGVACLAAACGDGIVAGDEECEDGGVPPMDGDGCSSGCLLEPGFACDTPGSPCRTTTCGDAVAEGTEQCDDGNNDTGDGCSPFCELEPMCTDGVCVTTCGDGVFLPGEMCDDGNTRSGDGCSSSCELEPGFDCTSAGGGDPSELVLPIVLRDFRGRDLSGGHPDFEYTIGDDRGILATMLGADHKPVYARGAAGVSPTTHGQAAFDQWYRDTPGVNITRVDPLTLGRTGAGTYVFDDASFFPLDGRGWVAMGLESGRTGGHNFHFTSELRYWFQYQGGEVLGFRGDDDVWVFINQRLAIDIGGVHGAETASITLDATQATRLGLTLDGVYEVVVYQAERHTTQSSYRLTLSNFTTSSTRCTPVCGDAVVTRYEACDDGVNDGSYGGCMPGCLEPGPYCGDGVTQAAEGEECDDGNLVDDDACSNRCTTVVIF